MSFEHRHIPLFLTRQAGRKLCVGAATQSFPQDITADKSGAGDKDAAKLGPGSLFAAQWLACFAGAAYLRLACGGSIQLIGQDRGAYHQSLAVNEVAS